MGSMSWKQIFQLIETRPRKRAAQGESKVLRTADHSFNQSVDSATLADSQPDLNWNNNRSCMVLNFMTGTPFIGVIFYVNM